MSAAIELQKAIHAALIADGALAASPASQRFFDHVPAKADFPYVTHGPAGTTDWSTSTETGEEHLLTLRIWSRARGRQEAETISSLIRAALTAPLPPMPSHRLILFRFEASAARYDAGADAWTVSLRFRALTEPN